MQPRFQQFRAGSQPQGQLEDPRTHVYRNGVSWAILPHVRATITIDGAVLLDIDKGLCYSLNIVGAKIWQVLESGSGHATFEDIVRALVQQFNVSPEELAKDIAGYLWDLEQKTLIKAVSDT